MRNKSVFLILLLCLILSVTFSVTLLSCSRSQKENLESYIQIELHRLQETYRLLDRFAQDIWPGWDNFGAIDIWIDFPNKLEILVTSKRTVPAGFINAEGWEVFDKKVYINRKNEIGSSNIKLPLVVGRGRGGLNIQIELIPLDLPEDPGDRAEKIETALKTAADEDIAFDIAPQGDSDGHILMYVHEHFHGYQASFYSIGPGAAGLRDFKVNTAYAVYSHIEGLALLAAYSESDQGKSQEYMQDFIVARTIKHSQMPPEVISAEKHISVVEGTPTYVSLKMSELIKDNSYHPKISPDDDPYFFQFNYLTESNRSLIEEGMIFAAEWSQDKRGKYYIYGALQCYLLDRFIPGWKDGFFENKRNLDEVFIEFLNLSPADFKNITQRIKTRYSFDTLYY